MPAGDLVTADWHVEIRTTLTGFGTATPLGEGLIAGIDTPAPKARDLELDHAAGSYLGRDYMGPRLITIDYSFGNGTTASSAGASLAALNTLWAPSETDIELHFKVPGMGHLKVVGRPRGLIAKTDLLYLGIGSALATFVCGDPTMTVI